MNFNIYDIVAYIIIGGATFFVVRSFLKKTQKSKDCDSGCDGCSTPCELKSIADKNLKNKSTF